MPKLCCICEYYTQNPANIRQYQPGDICGPLISEIWPHRGREQWALVLEASLLLAHQRGTVCRRS